MQKKQLKAEIKANPEFISWIKEKPDLFKKVKKDTKAAEEVLMAWKRSQMKKEGIRKIAENYRGMVDQIQELHSLLQKVDTIVSDVKNMSKTVQQLQLQQEDTHPGTSAKKSNKSGRTSPSKQ